jgi:NAD dependent epimerase/dehydratase family enzyme
MLLLTDGPDNLSAKEEPSGRRAGCVNAPVTGVITDPAKWMLAIGAFFMRTETELVLKSRRVIPGRLLESGFVFQFPTWPEAATDLCRR